MTETTPTIQVNELFGPTIQGEGPLIGRPCFFIRLHNCPVKCPGCDTHFTWDGSEKGKAMLLSLPQTAQPDRSQDKIVTQQNLENWMRDMSAAYPHCGFVLSGGEPLLHYKNKPFVKLLMDFGAQRSSNWLALETSGYVGGIPVAKAPAWPNIALRDFMECFNSISLSPKTTPCLRGEGMREDLLCNVKAIMDTWDSDDCDYGLFIKMVARDQADVDEIIRCNEEFGWQVNGLHIYVMPYGQERDEVLKACEFLVPQCAKYGFILTPRLHSLIWGKERLR